MTTVAVAHQAGQVVRYHTNPILWRFGQTNADHTHGVIMIILKLHPNPSRNLLAAATVHDSGERWAGDLSYPFKRANPEAAAQHAVTELRLAIENGIPQFEITLEEKQWLFFADKLESYLYVQLLYSALQAGAGWPEMRIMLTEMAIALGVNEEIF